MKCILLILFVIATFSLSAQTCLETAIQKGQTAYNQGNYAKDRDCWETGKGCDPTNSKKLNNLIWKTRDADKDSIVNGCDQCPNKSGTKANNGCPIVVPEGFVLVIGGEFIMGDLFDDGIIGEKPTHSVTLSDFYLGTTEVTFKEYDAFCTATGRSKPNDGGWGRGQRPVINVDWYDAVEYCNWLSQKENLMPVYTIDKKQRDPNNSNRSDTKRWFVSANAQVKGYRLPTEAEWEFAAREGGIKVRFGNGKDIIRPAQVNFDAIEAVKKEYSIVGEYRKKTVPVNKLRGAANGLGLRHMSGNVWEWCSDWYGENYYAESVGVQNPTGPVSGQYRVLRGGSWFNFPYLCRSAFRYWSKPYRGCDLIGFRVARGH